MEKPTATLLPMARTPRSESDKHADVLLGKRITHFRKEKGLTQIELAEKIGVGQPVLSNYEHGRLRPNHVVLATLATALQISCDELLGLQTIKGKGPLNRRLLRRLRAIEGLPRRDQEALLRTIDAFLSKAS